MIFQIALIISTVKIFFIPLYHSTDFEVHRNWLAITHNVSMDKWYYESTSQWTLDYPPFFAWLEHGLSQIGKFFDPEMLKVENLNYKSQSTIVFQRMTVILLDVVYISGIRSCTTLLTAGKALASILLISNPGLLMVDHIHFQYNGFLYGILFYSISYIIKSDYLQGAMWFAVLLNFKHIFLYMAPVYVVFLLRSYCFTLSTTDGVHTPWHSFSIVNLFKLAITVMSIFVISFGPFVDHLPQVFSRLFPFKRGLCHAYWAPNFWALYNMADKVLQHSLLFIGFSVQKTEAAMTGGLVQEYSHVVLPSVTPAFTFALTALFMLPALIKLWHLGADRRYRNMSFIRCLIVCTSTAFIFGWHVHEKAILMILIPMSFMSVLGSADARQFLIISTIGLYSLFPLLYPKNLLSIKIFMFLTYISIIFSKIPEMYELPRVKGARRYTGERAFLVLPGLNRLESMYLYGVIVLCMYENVFHSMLGLDKSLPFLPLMITSVYCSFGVIYSWFYYYIYFLTFNVSSVPMMVPRKTSFFAKKVT